MKNFVLPFRDLVVSPGLAVPILIDNPMSVSCVKSAAESGSQQLILVPQHSWAYPTSVEDIYSVGTIGEIVHILTMPDGAIHALIRTNAVVNLQDIEINDGIFSATPQIINIQDDMSNEQTIVLRDILADCIQNLANTTRRFKMDKLRNVMNNYPLPAFIDATIQTTGIETDVAVKVLRATSWAEKLTILIEEIKLMSESAKIEESINKRIHQQMENGRREAILQEKMRAIQQEMGEDDIMADTINMRKKIQKSLMPTDAKEKAMSEWKRMRSMSPMSNEGGLLKTYLDELLAMPWGQCATNDIDLHQARNVLDSEHSGMQSVKERILEHIAVMKKTKSNQGSILCFRIVFSTIL